MKITQKANNNLVNFVNNLNDDIQFLVCIGERNHWIFTNDDEIEESWAECFEVIEIVDEKKTSVIIKIKCLF